LNRRSRAEIVDFSSDDDSKTYCKHCLEYGFQVRLKNRIYPDNEPIPLDHSNFLQCHSCGLIVPIYEIEKEASIKDVIETSDNPFDIAKNSFLGIDSRKARKKKERQKQLDDIKDDEVKRELAKGNTLISYIEYQPQ
jgi:hypothetical protein